MEADASTPEVHDPSPGTGLGGRLVAAREAKGLTLAVVASKLRLSAATLQAIESNRLEDLPEPIFVRGYLRACARLLEIDGKALVAEYDGLVARRGPVPAPTRVRRQATARDPFIRGAIALSMVTMAVVFGYWWYSRQTHDVPAQAPNVSSGTKQPVSPASVLPPPQIDSTKPAPGPVAALPPDIPSQSPASEAGEERVAAVEAEPQSGQTPAETGPVLPQVNEASVTADGDAEGQHPDVEAAVEPATADLPIAPLSSGHGQLVRASRAPTGEDVLVIKANDDSWAEVVDANDYQLLYYPMRAGTVLRLQGQAPFRVFLGNAPAVDLSVNRKPFDHTRFHRRNSTARFTAADDS